MAFNALDTNLDQGKLLPAVLVGSLGGSCIIPMLRLSAAISENGKEPSGKLMKAGIVPPVSDLLQSSLSGMSCDKFDMLHYFECDLSQVFLFQMSFQLATSTPLYYAYRLYVIVDVLLTSEILTRPAPVL